MCLGKIKRGRVLKGKTFSIYKIIFVVAAVMSMVIGAGLYFIPIKEKSYAAEAVVERTQDFSQVDANGNIFSVEKVYVASGDNKNDSDYENSSIVQDFLVEKDDGSWSSMQTSQNKKDAGGNVVGKESYYYQHIRSASNVNKTVVANNSFVMLNNKVSADGVVSSVYESEKQEAILVSFGQYDFKDDGTVTTEEVAGKEISQINMVATLNGKNFAEEGANGKSKLPAVRQFGGEGNNLYQDFVFVIPQIQDYAGHWYFDITYYYGGNLFTQHFEFYLLFNSAYTQKDQIGTEFYTAEPNLSTDEFKLGTKTQYPTLTYDYTKYNMTYVHNANGVETKFEYKYNSTTKKLDLKINDKPATPKSLEYLNKNTSGANYVVFVLTEAGNYNFTFEYIYGGYVRDESSRPAMNLDKIKASLKINGFEVKYSKYGYEEAQMRYLDIVKSSISSDVQADIIIPNGHNFANANPSVDKMGIVYNLVEDKTTKVGTVVASKDANVNLEGFTDLEIRNIFKNIKTTIDGTAIDGVNALLEYAKYIKTNQGSIWLSSPNDYVSSSSFYYFSKTGEITENDLFRTKKNADGTEMNPVQWESTMVPLTNTTEFNKTGYYLVFVGVDINDDESNAEFYQVFAFQYTTDTININVVDEDDETKIIGAGKYTNNEVVVSWEEPGVFDRKIEANYYFAKSYNRETILGTQKHNLQNEQTIGYEITGSSTPTWATYVIEIKSEGDAATYRMFTIDTQNISGVAVYAVEQQVANGDTFYTFSVDGKNLIKVNAISNSYSTLYWDNKASGAGITVKYDFTPFVKDNSIVVDDVKNDTDGIWYSTNYKLGTTARGLEIFKVSALYESGIEINSSQVFSQQGIYEFTLTDAAGNGCKYLFIVDKTESYFYVDSTPDDGDDTNGVFTVNSNEIYSDDIKYSVGTHKVINLDESKLSDIAKAAIGDNLNAFLGYYRGDGNNISAIQNVLKKVSNNNYLIVKNMYVESYTSEDIYDANSSITSSNGVVYGFNSNKISRNKTDLGSSVIRKLYLVGENQTKTGKSKNTSFIQVEINVDNSRGMVYTRNDRKFDSSPTTAGNGVSRLTTGTDLYKDEHGDQIYGIEGAHATSDKYVVFTWLVGADNTKVKTVSYTFYEFDSNLNYTDEEFYFYKENGTTTTVFNSDVYSEGAKVDDDGKRAFAVINESNGVTREGLYVVTRTYVNEVSSGSKDFTTFNYYFIVDRSGIIEGAAGKEIKIHLLESETPFDDFSQHNAKPGKLEFADKDDVNYNVYLTTNKVPVTAYIPVGKYFNGTDSSNYYAGRLTFSVYFNDTERYLATQAFPYLLFEIDATESANKNNWSANNEFIINFENSNTLNDILKEHFPAWKEGANWMYLPGDYVIVINDMVEGVSGHNQKVVAFRVEQEKPEAEIYVTTEENSTTKFDQITASSTTLTTNQEFVKLEIPAYDANGLNAQLDQNYLVITQKIGDTTRDYINYPYENSGSPIYALDQASEVVSKDENKNITILLKTTNNSNELIVDKIITYTITVRYKLWAGNLDANRGEKFINCYVVGTDRYYEQTYTVVIDRIAPTANINNFTQHNGKYYDNLIADYNNRDGVKTMFETATYDNSGILYFTNRYTAFYDDSQKTSELYALKANKDTDFKTDDVAKVYSRFHSQGSLATLKLNLPITVAMGDTNVVEITNKITKYSHILKKDAGPGIYEIVEFDKAGNMTQYLIEYGLNSELEMSAEIEKINETKNVKIVDGLTFFDLKSVSISTDENFYQIIVKDINQNTISTIYADFTTKPEKIANKLKYSIITNGVEDDLAARHYGQYYILVNTRAGQVKYTVNYHNKATIRDLSLEKMVNKTTDPWTLNLAGANELVENELYYVKEIYITYLNENNEQVTRTYTSNNGVDYVNTTQGLGSESGAEFNIDIYNNSGKLVGFKTSPDTIYVVQAIDSADREVSTLKFKSGDDDYVYYGIWFGEDKENPANAIQEGTKFYSFQKATIQYDITAFSKAEVEYIVNGKRELSTTEDRLFNAHKIIEFKDNYVILHPYFSESGTGALLEFVVNLYAKTVVGDEIVEHSYTVIIDTRTNAVQLKDNAIGSFEILQFDANKNVLETPTPKMSSGSKMLIWTQDSHEKFNYSYALYEKLKEKDSTGKDYRVRDLNNEPGFYLISTGFDSLGEYRFVVEISDKYGNYLGRKIYTFAVKAELNKIYYVQTKDGENVEANSTFTYNDLEGIEFDKALPTITDDIHLYITNEELEPIIINNSDITENIYKATAPEFYSGVDKLRYFEIHEIDAKTYKLYFGILKITKNTGDLINRIAITDQDNQTTSIWSKTQTPASVEGVSVVGTEFNLEVDSIDQQHPFLRKNMIMVDVKYGEQLVDSFKLKLTNDSFELKGNGTYIFEVRDLAGNVQIFQTQYGAEFDYVQATVLREVEVNINGTAPLTRAFYNGVVNFSIVNRSNYEQGTIKWVATRNGVEYMTSNNIFSYSFKDYGSYRVVITAKPKNANTALIKVINFTIVNPKEAKQSFDLTNIANYDITEVLNNNGDNITNEFLEMLEFNESGKIVTYDMILNNPALNTGSRKQTFTITYRADDGLYPIRHITFQFTLNNEIPYVECSLEPGEDTTKEFSITFNPGIIFQQVGEAVICVNGQEIYRINEKSVREPIQKSFSEKVNGAGDYYITIQSLSGDMISAFKVTIKEPLNASAIIIIVVVSVVVIGIVVTFIVLRTKMRIR